MTNRCCCCALLVSSVLWTGCSDSSPSGKSGLSADQVADASAVVKACEKTLQGLAAYRCDLELTMNISAQGMQNKLVSDYSICVEQPRRWAIILESGMFGGTSVSDGKQLFSHAPMMQKYSVEDLPAGDLSDFWEGPPLQVGVLGPAAMAGSFMGSDLADWMLEGVESTEHLGSDNIGGKQYQHYKFAQKDGTQWQLWVEFTDQVLFRRFVITPNLPAAGGPSAGMSLSIQVDLTNWKLDAKPTEADFAYEPPPGHTKVDSLMGPLFGGPTVHPLVGELAPLFEVSNLDGSTFALHQHLGEQIVVLDFWATWCGPCTKALPSLASFAKEFAGREVAVYAVNQGEEPDIVKMFLAEEELELSVLLDADESVSESYQLEGIPTTVLIGKDKRIHAVHVGYSRTLEKQLAEEVKELLAGEDLASETLSRRQQRKQQVELEVEPKGTELLWSLKGDYSDVTVDQQTGKVYALSSSGAVSLITPTGEEAESIPLEQSERRLRLAQLVGDASPEFVTLGPWSHGIFACDSTGKKLWDYTVGQGVDDVACYDLSGDGIDEVIIGYNGGTGLHVLDNRGELLWKTTSIGNVWHVSAGQFTEATSTQVVTTSAQGEVHVFSAEGESITSHRVNLYANMVRLVRRAKESTDDALVGGSGDDEYLLLIDGQGKEIWRAALPILETPHIDSLFAEQQSGLAAVAMRGGLFHVLDLNTGNLVATVVEQGTTAQVALLSHAAQPPLLLIASGTALSAHTITDVEN